jgi:hypothetical protein
MDTLEQAGVEMDPEELEHMQTMGTHIHIKIRCIQTYRPIPYFKINILTNYQREFIFTDRNIQSFFGILMR